MLQTFGNKLRQAEFMLCMLPEGVLLLKTRVSTSTQVADSEVLLDETKTVMLGGRCWVV